LIDFFMNLFIIWLIFFIIHIIWKEQGDTLIVIILVCWLPVLNYCLYLKAKRTVHVIAIIGVIAFIAIIDEWMYFVRQLLRMTMLHINLMKKCISCDAEFASKRAADCHRRHPAYNGTACAYPSNIWFLSLTELPDISVRILRQHSAAPLGAWMYILHHPFTSYISPFN